MKQNLLYSYYPPPACLIFLRPPPPLPTRGAPLAKFRKTNFSLLICILDQICLLICILKFRNIQQIITIIFNKLSDLARFSYVFEFCWVLIGEELVQDNFIDITCDNITWLIAEIGTLNLLYPYICLIYLLYMNSLFSALY